MKKLANGGRLSVREIAKLTVLIVTTMTVGCGIMVLFVIVTEGTGSVAQLIAIYAGLIGVGVALLVIPQIAMRVVLLVPANLRYRFSDWWKQAAPSIAALAMVLAVAPEAFFGHGGSISALSRIVTGICACVGAYATVDWFLNGSWRNAKSDH